MASSPRVVFDGAPKVHKQHAQRNLPQSSKMGACEALEQQHC